MEQRMIGTTGLPSAGDHVPRPQPRRLSRIFRELASRADGPVSVADIRDAMGDRGFAALLVLFSLINLMPWPPGTTLVLGLPLVLISTQMIAGFQTPWLPARVLGSSLDGARFRSACARLVPRLIWLERLVRPRYWPFSRQQADRIIGLITLVFGLAVFLPIPLGNWLPALSIVIMGLALSERDGIFLAAGVVIGIVALLVIAAVVGAAGYVAGTTLGIAI